MILDTFVVTALLRTSVNWSEIFAVKVNLLELFVRGSAMYLGIFVVMRLFRRQKGALNAADLLVLLLVADAAQNALSAEYKSLTEGAVVVGTIFFWDYVLDTLSYLSKPLGRIINGTPTALVTDGQLNRKHMRREMLTKDDVLEQLREQGINDLSEVRMCYVETDGHFSVIKHEQNSNDKPPRATSGIS